MNKTVIRLDDFETLREFHLWLKEECHFPEYYGCNLDALYDCLTDRSDWEFEIVPSQKYEMYQARLVDTLVDAGCKVLFIIEE